MIFAPHQRVGLLGGSFNPAHSGHVHISVEAKKRLQLDRVVWLVSPQNPLKSHEGMADYETRLTLAKRITDAHPFISVSDFERKHQLYYSFETIVALQQQAPRSHLVWLMGADNLSQFHRWKDWRAILQRIPLAVLDRAPFSHHALHCKAALSQANRRIAMQHAAALPTAQAPAWCYLFMQRHPESATRLRKTLGEAAFL